MEDKLFADIFDIIGFQTERVRVFPFFILIMYLWITENIDVNAFEIDPVQILDDREKVFFFITGIDHHIIIDIGDQKIAV